MCPSQVSERGRVDLFAVVFSSPRISGPPSYWPPSASGRMLGPTTVPRLPPRRETVANSRPFSPAAYGSGTSFPRERHADRDLPVAFLPFSATIGSAKRSMNRGRRACCTNRWERALMAAEKVKERLRRATKALDDAGRWPYGRRGRQCRCRVGGAPPTRGPSAIHATSICWFAASTWPPPEPPSKGRGLSIINSSMLTCSSTALSGRPSEAVHILFAGEKVRPEYEHASPDLDESERAGRLPGHEARWRWCG